MALNGVNATGDDQLWKREVEKIILAMAREIQALKQTVDYLKAR